jgi:hypothetical protein
MCIPPIVARQELSKNVTAVMNTHATIAELLDASFSMLSMLDERKVGDWFFPELLVLLYIVSLAAVDIGDSRELSVIFV